MTKLAAIELSSRGARCVVVESNFRQSQVLGTFEVPREEEEADEALLARFKEQLPDDVETIIVAADGQSLSTHQLKFPFGDLRKVEQTLEFELENQVPYDVDDIVTSWTVAERDKNRTVVLAALSPCDRIEAQLNMWKDAGLEPRQMVHPSVGLSELCSASTEGPVAVLSIGSTQSHLAVVGALHQTQLARTMRVGGQNIDRVLAKVFGLTVDEARGAKEAEATWQPSDDERQKQITAAVEKGLAPLVLNLGSTFRGMTIEERPVKMLVTGGTSRLAGLTDYLSERLGIEVSLLDVNASLDAQTASQIALGPEFAVCAGLALASMRRGRNLPLDMRRGPFAYAGDLELYQDEAKRFGFGLATILTLAIAAAGLKYSMVRAYEKEVDLGFCHATKRIVGREICDPTAALATLRQSPGAESGISIPTYSAAKMFEMISRALDKDIDVNFGNLDLRISSDPTEPDRISGKGEAASFDSTAVVVSALRKDPCVQDAEISRQKRTGGERVEFNILVKVKCPPGRVPGQELTYVADASAALPASPSPVPELDMPEGVPPPGVPRMPTPGGVSPSPRMGRPAVNNDPRTGKPPFPQRAPRLDVEDSRRKRPVRPELPGRGAKGSNDKDSVRRPMPGLPRLRSPVRNPMKSRKPSRNRDGEE